MVVLQCAVRRIPPEWRGCLWFQHAVHLLLSHLWAGNYSHLCVSQLLQGLKQPNVRICCYAIRQRRLRMLGHEAMESISDPFINAWYYGSFQEIADLCAYTYGPLNYDNGQANHDWRST